MPGLRFVFRTWMRVSPVLDLLKGEGQRSHIPGNRPPFHSYNEYTAFALRNGARPQDLLDFLLQRARCLSSYGKTKSCI